jgi:hypothetical protein
MDAAAAHSENSRNGKQIAACESSPISLSSNAILSYRMGESLPSKASLKKSAANRCNIMPECATCLDAGDAHHTFTLENSSKPTQEETGR